MSNIKKLSKDTLIYGTGRVLKKLIGLFLLPFYTRALSPDQYGILNTLATISSFVIIAFGIGLGGATSRYFFIADKAKDKKKIIYTSSLIRLFSYSLPVSVLVIFAKNFSMILFNSTKYTWAIRLSSITILFTAFMQIQEQIFRYYREPIKYGIINVVRSLTNPIFGILFVVILQWGVFGATLSSMVSTFIVLSLAFFVFTKTYYIFSYSWKWAKKMIKFGFPLIFTGLLLWINGMSDRFFLLHFSNLEQIGYYSISNTFSQPILLLNQALQMSALVFVFSMYNKEDDPKKPETKKFLTQLWHLYLSISAIITLFISIFSYEIVSIITTEEYINGILGIPLLSFGLIFQQSYHITGNGMTLKENTKPYAWIMLIAAATNVGLNFYFVPKLGFVGASITTTISNFTYFLVSYFWSQKYFYIKRSFIKPLLYILISLGIAIFFPFAKLQFNIDTNLFHKFIAIIIALILPFLFGMLRIEYIRNLLNKLKKKYK